MIYPYKGVMPKIDESAYIADYVTITGDVKIGKSSSIWFNTVIRGDVAPTVIGDRVNVQDQSMLHQSPDMPLILEDDVTVGHQVLLHSAKIRAGALIGMGAMVMDDVEVGEGAFVGAGSLLPPGKSVPPNTLVMGRPAKVVRELTDEDQAEMARIRQSYIDKGEAYREITRGLTKDD
ncbi:carbonic anhydrase/acetyltransferase-like protein (isoleucine patch superfamily) [Salsuginibacillus halophilus]|uniref:Carbonic anhydrase/acetyltransferase-like protein (Isoleucine patch superfamily) n=1 Tax=Salsuginibacillus halophilus TaxID=517424 RepID=A0A2P8HE45_9BACI|nr:gamma carbonic anhydrase family protein [Salsuginibacillus halophilus]PSL44496.1 carbonic anhydrase/acetyltransferase-like protein (isoleucine patch superfamily) [Salsuginibacillus halophilus]